MLILKEDETCPHSNSCPHNKNSLVINEDNCYGASLFRDTTFTCLLVDERGNIKESGYRLPGDKTGKMKILID